MQLKYFFSLILIFLGGNLFSQARNEVIQQRIEFISEQLQSEDIDLTNIIESLNFYFDNKLNLNSAVTEELEELNLLTSVQINDLLTKLVQHCRGCIRRYFFIFGNK